MTTLFGPANIALGTDDVVSRVKLYDGPLELSWHHCATTSDFIGELFALRIRSSTVDNKDVRHSVGYLVNELIENAVKFRAQGEILIEASMDAESFRVKISNLLDGDTAARFQTRLAEITHGDPGELLIQRIEANAADDGSSESGLGLLTLMSDYGARLAWIFSPTERIDHVQLETFASLPIYSASN